MITFNETVLKETTTSNYSDVFKYTMIGIWILLIIVAIIVEIMTASLFGIGTAVAAAIALFVHLGTRDYYTEFIVFIAMYVLSWSAIFVVLHYRQKNRKHHDEIAEKFIDKEVKITEILTPKEGRALLNDVSYRFISSDELKEGDIAIVKDYKGVTLTVAKKGKEE